MIRSAFKTRYGEDDIPLFKEVLGGSALFW